MIRDITIGQFYPGNSFVHKLDPRTKINITFVFIISLFIKPSFVSYIFAVTVILMVIKITEIPIKFMLKGLKAIFIIILMTVIFNLFLTPGEVVIRIWKLTITREGLQIALLMGSRLIMLIIGSSILTLTTTPITLTDGIERLLQPLKRIGVPAHEIAMMMTIALRFIPILLEETDKIMKAQMARGADFETGGLLKRAKNMVPLLVPLFISSFRRADDLAIAMEARCYRGGEGRTRMVALKYSRLDIIAYIF
ncbi:MAG: energy-coupling factor transporter transmembrane protein EcfT, partial [Candidatus Atribacteria bacterium]|nr:energy-coupling factor transporter transmembrane protein EcfT [Candidatus Atribacteria bacterium]